MKLKLGIKIAGRNINSLRYADNSTLMAESKEEIKSLLMRVKEENEKAIDFTIQTFVGKVISLLFNMLSRFVIAFHSRIKSLLISWL